MNATSRACPWDGASGRPLSVHACAAIAAAVSLTGYLATLCPTLGYGGDCGDLIASSFVLGNCHPTGYPLYLVAGKLFSAVPLGDVAFRYNLFSAVAGAAAIYCASLLIAGLSRCGIAAIAGGVTVGSLYLLWTQCVIAEVYALGTLFVCALLLAAHRWLTEDDARWLLAAGLLAGLGVAHHLSSSYASIPVAACCVMTAWRRPGGLRLLLLAGAFAGLGLLLYAYLPLRAAAAPALNWGDPSTVDAFVAHVTGRLYRGHLFGTPLADVPQRLAMFGILTCAQLALSTVWLPVGLIGVFRRGRGFTVLLLAVVGLNLAAGIRYDVGDVWNFFLPAFVVLGVFAGVGLGSACTWLARRDPSGRGGLFATAIACLCVVTQAMFVAPQPDVNMRGNRLAREYNEATLAAVPPGAALFVKSDENLFSLWYLQNVEAKNCSVEILSVPRLETFGHGYAEEVRRRLGKQPVFCAFYPQELVGQYNMVCHEATTQVVASPPPVVLQPEAAGAVSLRHRGLALRFASPAAVRLKKGNTAAMAFWWSPNNDADLPNHATLELLCVRGTPGAAVPVKGDPAVHGSPNAEGVVRRWRFTYPLASGRRVGDVFCPEGQNVHERISLTVPWNADRGRYQVFARVCTGDGECSSYERVAQLMAVQR